MGIFSFRKGKGREDDLFARCDFQFASNELISKFYGSIIPKELASLLDAFNKNPCTETARPLIQYDSNFAMFFQDNKSRKESYEAFGYDTLHPAKTVAMLRHEPEFEEYCNSITLEDDMKRHKELEAQLLSKGYSDKLIREALAQYFQDLL